MKIIIALAVSFVVTLGFVIIATFVYQPHEMRFKVAAFSLGTELPKPTQLRINVADWIANRTVLWAPALWLMSFAGMYANLIHNQASGNNRKETAES